MNNKTFSFLEILKLEEFGKGQFQKAQEIINSFNQEDISSFVILINQIIGECPFQKTFKEIARYEKKEFIYFDLFDHLQLLQAPYFDENELIIQKLIEYRRSPLDKNMAWDGRESFLNKFPSNLKNIVKYYYSFLSRSHRSKIYKTKNYKRSKVPSLKGIFIDQNLYDEILLDINDYFEYLFDTYKENVDDYDNFFISRIKSVTKILEWRIQIEVNHMGLNDEKNHKEKNIKVSLNPDTIKKEIKKLKKSTPRRF